MRELLAAQRTPTIQGAVRMLHRSPRAQDHLILVAEDDEGHAFLIKRAFEQARLMNPVQFVSDGAQAVAYLKGEAPYENREEFPLPSLLLLDLKMPNKDGFEVLEWIRAQPTLKALRVIVLTTSGATRDINRAYQLGANSFLTKPMNFTDLVTLTRWVKGYWLHFSHEPEIKRSEPAADQKRTSASPE